MKTVVLEQPGKLCLVDVEMPARPGPGEALVRVWRVGICGTDVHAFKGEQPFFSYPRILGHELAVEVLELGPGCLSSDIRVGDNCCLNPYMHCGRCGTCRRGLPNCCEHLQVLGVHTDGGMCEMLLVPVAKLHRSELLPLDQLALVEMLCIGAHAVRRAQIRPGQPVLVIGAGPIGLAVSWLARLAGADVVGMELSASRRAFCRSQLGVEHWVDGQRDQRAQLRDLLCGELPTVVFDATGNPASMTRSFDYVAHGGRLVFVGLFQGDITFHDPEFHRRELSLLASRNATDADFAQVIGLLSAGRLDLAPWITHRVPLEAIPHGFAGLLDPDNGLVKAVVECA
ncbi:MAG TPA: zinc-binding alcohol dehydrogenase family protein [Roseiflexaceae bacterium]|nr:zinc-binding alcohol dehydrogenase family protein [Roseiflexaceae bacterium]